jgi:hypothetical protein
MLGRIRARVARRISPTPQAQARRTFVFVVTYGRSGSTLLQGVLNVLPQTIIRGENGMYALELFQAHRRATGFAAAHASHRPRKVQSAFYGAHLVTDQRLAVQERSLMLAMLLPRNARRRARRVGFKEVAWHRIAAEDTEAFFDWFELVFPEARYVLNTRKIEDAVTSGFWRSRDPEEALAAMHRVIEIQDYLRSTRPERVLETRYEVITGEDAEASAGALGDLATFVTGGCDDALLERMREVLDVRHGPDPAAMRQRKKKRRGAASHG